MTSLRTTAILIAAAAVAMPGAASARRREVPPIKAIGEPVDCIQSSRIRETHVRDDHTIDFITNGGVRLYRNTLPHACPGLGFEQRFAYSTQTDQLCSVDIITVLDSPGLMRGASCGLGKFQPAIAPKR